MTTAIKEKEKTPEDLTRDAVAEALAKQLKRYKDIRVETDNPYGNIQINLFQLDKDGEAYGFHTIGVVYFEYRSTWGDIPDKDNHYLARLNGCDHWTIPNVTQKQTTYKPDKKGRYNVKAMAARLIERAKSRRKEDKKDDAERKARRTEENRRARIRRKQDEELKGIEIPKEFQWIGRNTTGTYSFQYETRSMKLEHLKKLINFLQDTKKRKRRK